MRNNLSVSLLAFACLVIMCACAAAQQGAATPAGGTQVYSASVTSVRKTPEPDKEMTRVDIVVKLENGTTISAYCEGNAFSGLVNSAADLCAFPALGNDYQVWYKSDSEIYLKGHSGSG